MKNLSAQHLQNRIDDFSENNPPELTPSEKYLLIHLAEKGQSLSPGEIWDFGLTGSESTYELRQIAGEYLSDLDSEREEEKAWRDRGQFDHLTDLNQ